MVPHSGMKTIFSSSSTHTNANPLIFSSFIDQYFGGSFDVEMKCAEAPDEPSTLSKENFLQLSCFISQEVKYMLSGLRSVIKLQSTMLEFNVSVLHFVIGLENARAADQNVGIIVKGRCLH